MSFNLVTLAHSPAPVGYLLTLQKSERVRDGQLTVYVCLYDTTLCTF